MKNIFKSIVVMLVTVVCGCTVNPIKSEQTDNPSVNIDLLMQHDGCKIYRFTDGGRNHYFVKCADTKITSTDTTIPEGKTSIVETIQTVKEK